VLSGRTIVVTGAARGVGRAIARACARHHARLVLGDVLEDAGRDAALEFGKFTQARFVPLDLNDPDSIAGFADDVAQREGDRTLCRVVEIAAGATVADLTAEIDAGPAVDVHGRRRLRAGYPTQIVREGAWRERKRQQCIYDATHRTPFPLVAGDLRARTLKGG